MPIYNVPLMNIPVVYHIGTLNKEDRGTFHRASQEGSGLSVSLCPDAWRSIAQLGGTPLQQLSRHDAMFLDLMNLTPIAETAARMWAADEGFLEQKKLWKSWHYDDEFEGWSYMLHSDKEAAIREVDSDEDEDSIVSQVERPSDAQRNGPIDNHLVEMTSQWMLTDKGVKRANGWGRDVDGTDMAIMFWAEDVLRKHMPEIVGVWWRETFNPEEFSAPRGAIFPRCIARFESETVEWSSISDDEDLLSGMPNTRNVALAANKTDYQFVTNCVCSTAELISPMVESAASQEMEFSEFTKELGNGSIKKGRQILDDVFPTYKELGVSIDKDPYVKFMKSSFEGMPCLYVVHSAIEYVFQRIGYQQSSVLHLEHKQSDHMDNDNFISARF